jgi:hypothetical protein
LGPASSITKTTMQSGIMDVLSSSAIGIRTKMSSGMIDLGYPTGEDCSAHYGTPNARIEAKMSRATAASPEKGHRHGTTTGFAD